MKKIMILTVVAVAAASIGCSQCGPRTSWFRGDSCNDCATYKTTPNYEGYPSGIANGYPSGIENGYPSGVVNGYNNGTIIPNLPALPGPDPTNP